MHTHPQPAPDRPAVPPSRPLAAPTNHSASELADLIADRVLTEVRNALAASTEITKHESQRLLTLPEVAERLGISIRTAEALVADGELVAVRIRTARRFTQDAIERFIRANAGKQRRRKKRQ